MKIMCVRLSCESHFDIRDFDMIFYFSAHFDVCIFCFFRKRVVPLRCKKISERFFYPLSILRALL